MNDVTESLKAIIIERPNSRRLSHGVGDHQRCALPNSTVNDSNPGLSNRGNEIDMIQSVSTANRK